MLDWYNSETWLEHTDLMFHVEGNARPNFNPTICVASEIEPGLHRRLQGQNLSGLFDAVQLSHFFKHFVSIVNLKQKFKPSSWSGNINLTLLFPNCKLMDWETCSNPSVTPRFYCNQKGTSPAADLLLIYTLGTSSMGTVLTSGLQISWTSSSRKVFPICSVSKAESFRYNSSKVFGSGWSPSSWPLRTSVLLACLSNRWKLIIS